MRFGAQRDQRSPARGHVPRWRRQWSQSQLLTPVKVAEVGRVASASGGRVAPGTAQNQLLSPEDGSAPHHGRRGRGLPLLVLLAWCGALAWGSWVSPFHSWWVWAPWSQVRFIVGHCGFTMSGADKGLIYFTWFFLSAGAVVGVLHETAGRNLVRGSLACASASAAIFGASFIESSIISPRPDPACPPVPSFADQLLATDGQLATLALDPLLPIVAVLVTFAWRARSEADHRWEANPPGYWGWRLLVAAALACAAAALVWWWPASLLDDVQGGRSLPLDIELFVLSILGVVALWPWPPLRRVGMVCVETGVALAFAQLAFVEQLIYVHTHVLDAKASEGQTVVLTDDLTTSAAANLTAADQYYLAVLLSLVGLSVASWAVARLGRPRPSPCSAATGGAEGSPVPSL